MAIVHAVEAFLFYWYYKKWRCSDASRSTAMNKKLCIGLCILVILFLIWLELAVGLIGTPWAGS